MLFFNLVNFYELGSLLIAISLSVIPIMSQFVKLLDVHHSEDSVNIDLKCL